MQNQIGAKTYTCLKHGERMNILAKIYKGKSLSQISKDLNRSKSTIIREIQRNLYFPVHPQKCSYCSKNKHCIKSKGISQKRWLCPDFEPLLCERQKHFPYVCNGCEKRACCNHAHCYYNCDSAHETARYTRENSRSNKHVTKEQLDKINQIVSDGVKKGQSLYHIWATNPYIKNLVTEITIRRYLYDGLFDVRPIQLHRKKRYSKKYDYSNAKNKYKMSIADKENRTYYDFKKYLESTENKKDYWEYDSIEGKKHDKTSILTITYVELAFQAGFKIRKHNPDDVLKILRKLQSEFGDDYKKIFRINISDNGTEFGKFHEIEWDEKTGEIITKTFFTNPFKATDKPHCERSHEYFRYVIPKGNSIEFLTQEQISLIFSHINSYVRKTLNEKSPYDLFVQRFGKKAADILGIIHINPKDVNLSPSVLKAI